MPKKIEANVLQDLWPSLESLVEPVAIKAFQFAIQLTLTGRQKSVTSPPRP